MIYYHPLLLQAIAALPDNDGAARRALYERAKAALLTELRAVKPPLSEFEITRERLALEEAIRRIEAEYRHRHPRHDAALRHDYLRGSQQPVRVLYPTLRLMSLSASSTSQKATAPTPIAPSISAWVMGA
jgi:hypothetical protein